VRHTEQDPGIDEAERMVYRTLLARFGRGFLATLDAVVADLKALRGDRDGEAWLRQRLEGLA
jgi:hypothetical protein